MAGKGEPVGVERRVTGGLERASLKDGREGVSPAPQEFCLVGIVARSEVLVRSSYPEIGVGIGVHDRPTLLGALRVVGASDHASRPLRPDQPAREGFEESLGAHAGVTEM